MTSFMRKYGVETTIVFPVPKLNDTDFAATGDWTPAATDIRITKDAGTLVDCSNTAVAVSGTGSLLWALTLTATEMEAAVVTLQIVDAVLEHDAITIETYGHANAQHAFDLDTALVTLAATTHTGAVIPTVSALTGHTVQTADHTAGIAAIPTTMVGTNNAALASEVTAARMSELDAGTGGKMANQVDEIRTDTGQIGTAGAGLSDLGGMSTPMKAEVKVEVDAVISTDTGSEEASVPAAAADLRAQIQLLYQALRNKLDITNSAKEIHKSDGTLVATKVLTDDGTTYSEAKMT